MRRFVPLFLCLALVLLAALGWASPAAAAGSVVLDGQFNDWVGQPFVSDPQGDASRTWNDLRYFYFATNPGVGTAYFMAQRWAASSRQLHLYLLIDTNNDGAYNGTGDRLVTIDYRPSGGRVDVALYNGRGTFIKTIASNARWGERNPGDQVEWGISFADLGIAPYQTIRMTLESMQGSSVSDQVVEVQWSPASALGLPLLGVLLAAGAGWLFYRRKQIA
jgi:LPXTG-motif cell wall-anchored protein